MRKQPTAAPRAARLGWAVLATLVVVAVELVAGIVGQSVALLADAGHVAVDAMGLGLAWWAVAEIRRPPSGRNTYGYQRVGTLMGLGNALLLLFVVGGIGAAASLRLANPARPDPALMAAAAGFGVLANLVTVSLIRGDRSFNARAALLHVAGDLVAGLGVLAAAVAIALTGWARADPLVSLLISLVIAVGAVRLLREGLPVILESAPSSMSLAVVEEYITATPGVSGVHDLHVWQLALDRHALSCHLALTSQSLEDAEHLVQDLSERLCSRFELHHTTIQVEACHPCPPGLCADQVSRFDNHVHRARDRVAADRSLH